MKMEFVFDKSKLEESGYTEEQCLNIIRNYFKSYNSDTIKEIAKGIFEGSESDWNAFASTARFPYTNWFLKVIKEWYWYNDEGDGKGEQKGDCLKAYYKVAALKV